MPRRGATGDAGGAAGGKVQNRSTNEQLQRPSNGPAPRRLLISESRLLMSAAFMQVKKTPPPPRSQSERTFLRSAYSGFCWIPPVVRRLFEVNSEPRTGARPSVRLCVELITHIASNSPFPLYISSVCQNLHSSFVLRFGVHVNMHSTTNSRRLHLGSPLVIANE